MKLLDKEMLWHQYGAALDMLENAMIACPDHVWGDKLGWHEFWYLASHTLFFTDLDLSETSEGFLPPPPFGLEELDEKGVLPPRVYTKQELLTYLAHCREKLRKTIAGLTEEKANREAVGLRNGYTFAELYLYSMRHVQHHAAQLNLILRQQTDSAPRWVRRTKTPLVD